MGGVRDVVRRTGNLIQGRGFRTTEERAAQAEAERRARKDELFQTPVLPDPVEERRRARRRFAGRRGSRVTNVLTQNSDTLGPGGA